jgi:multidrug efflux pump subunit AcrA (membrane-fusion protein)
MAVPRPIQFPGPRRGLPINQQTLAAAGLALVAIVLAALIGHDVVFPPSQNAAASLRTAAVTRGTVRSAVSATGTLVPAQQLNVGFKTAGTLTEVDVKVGDKVTAGQVLAKLDPTQLQLALDQANANLASAQANLQNTSNGTALVQAQHALDQARQNYSNAVNNQNTDQNTLNADTNTLNADQAGYWYQQYAPTLTSYQNSLNTDNNQFRTDGCNPSTTYVSGQTPCYTDQQNVKNDLNSINCIQGGIGSCTPQQQQIAGAYKTVQADQGRVSADQAKVNADGSQVQSAQNQVTNALDTYNNQAANRPATIAQQQAAVASAQAAVNTAQNNLNGATLTAPSDGVIAAVNGGPGDGVTAQTSSSVALAPGSTAPLPSSGSSGSGSSGSGAGSAFITLLNTTGYQAVVTFAESDAAKVQAGQTGTVTFDALQNVTIPVHVLAVAPASTTVSNVVNYYVTLTLDNLNSNLRAGLTTNAQIVVSQVANVLTVPNSAITRLGQNAFVTVLGANGVQTRTPVQVGVTGYSSTEITSGLQAGDKVVLPQLRASSTASNRGLGGGGGLGGPVIAGGRG